MKKIFLALAIIAMPFLFNSCAIQQEVEIYRKKNEKTDYFMHQKHTVRDGLFSKNRKLRTRHRYFYRDSNGKWHFRPSPYRRDFIHYKRTGVVIGTHGKVRVIKRGTVALPAKKRKK